MANPNITLLGASYTGVSGVTLPKTGGGTATFPFVEGSQTITQNGTVDVTNLAEVIVNVAGGGGGGLEYETGTYTPSSDTARLTIPFSNSHNEAPVLILFSDMTGTAHSTTNTNYNFIWADFYKLWGHGIPYTSSGYRYAVASYSYRGNSTSSLSSASLICQQTSDVTQATNSTYPRYWVTPTEFHPYSNSTSRYWRTGRTYKWIAVWKP